MSPGSTPACPAGDTLPPAVSTSLIPATMAPSMVTLMPTALPTGTRSAASAGTDSTTAASRPTTAFRIVAFISKNPLSPCGLKNRIQTV